MCAPSPQRRTADNVSSQVKVQGNSGDPVVEWAERTAKNTRRLPSRAPFGVLRPVRDEPEPGRCTAPISSAMTRSVWIWAA